MRKTNRKRKKNGKTEVRKEGVTEGTRGNQRKEKMEKGRKKERKESEERKVNET